MRSMLILGLIVVVAGWAVGQEVSVVGVAGAGVKDLAGSPTLVTVVLKKGGAKDPNLRVLEVHPKDFTVLTEKGDQFTYLNEDVQEIRVQGGKVEKPVIALHKGTALRAEDQKIVERAWVRAREIFAASNDNQERKIKAATLLSLHGDEDARTYLGSLAASNEIRVKLDAALALYLGGEKPSESLLREGLESGNLTVRVKAAALCGLSGYRDAVPLIKTMLQDRFAELSAPAARALARLEEREVVPKLIEMLGESDERKFKAAIFSLARLGGDDIIEQMKLRLKQVTEPQVRYRIALILHALGDPMGSKLLAEVFDDVPTLAPEAALLLAKEGNWDATQFLRARMARRENPTDDNLLYRARNAAALFKGGDPSASVVFQELLRSDNTKVKTLVLELIAEANDRKLLAIIQSSIENIDNGIALDACVATVSLALPEFRARLLETRD